MTYEEKKDFYRELRKLAVPIGIQSFLTALIGVSDALMLGRLDQESVAAVSIANQAAFLMSLFSYAIVSGGSVLISQYLGKNDRRTAQNIFCFVMKVEFLLTLVFFTVGFFFPDFFMRLYTPETELITIGASYLRIVSVSYLMNGMTLCFFMIMKVEGRARKTVVISAAMAVTNVIGDLFLIYGIWFFPKLRADGSAYATIAVEAVALVWCVIESVRGKGIRPDLKGMKWFSAEHAKDYAKVSLPMMASGVSWGVGFSLHSMIMGHLGTDAAASSSIAGVIQELVTCLIKGTAAGTGIMIGRLLGQDLFEKAKRYAREFWNVSLKAGLISAGIIALSGPLVVLFFKLTDTARSYLIFMLAYSALFVFGYSYNNIITCGVFPAGGDSRYDAWTVLISMWGFALPLSILGTFVFGWPVMLIYAVMMCDEIIKVPWIWPRYKKYLWLRNLTREESPDGQE